MSKAREISELGDVVAVDGSNVGIGTTSPDCALHVESSASGASTSVAALVNPNSGVVGTGARLWLSGSNATTRGAYIDAIVQNSGNAHDMVFATNGDASSPTERMRIDASGNVGIGTSSPLAALHVTTSTTDYTGDVVISGTRPYLVFDDTTAGQNGFSIGVDGGAVTFGQGDFSTNSNVYGTERMRIDASGNLLVGKTSPSGVSTNGAEIRNDGIVIATKSGGVSGYFGRTSSDGEIMRFYRDSTTVGSIGVHNSDLTVGDGDAGLKYSSSSNQIYPWNMSTNAISDNLLDMGTSSGRFDDIYATNGTIQTSDANEKQQIAELTAAEMQAAKAISKLFKTFKWNDSVAEKGDDARIHTGVIAQEVEAAMTAAGLDAGKYAFFISSTWWESTEVIPAVEAVAAVEATYDEEGNILTEAVEAVEAQPERTVTHTHDTAEEAPAGAVERTRKGIRYPQLLAFIGAATEQRLASIEARLDALETV